MYPSAVKYRDHEPSQLLRKILEKAFPAEQQYIWSSTPAAQLSHKMSDTTASKTLLLIAI